MKVPRLLGASFFHFFNVFQPTNAVCATNFHIQCCLRSSPYQVLQQRPRKVKRARPFAGGRLGHGMPLDAIGYHRPSVTCATCATCATQHRVTESVVSSEICLCSVVSLGYLTSFCCISGTTLCYPCKGVIEEIVMNN